MTKRHDRGCRNPEERDVLERAAQRSTKTTGLSFQQPSLPPDPLCLPRCRQLHSLPSSLLPFGCGSVDTFNGLLQSSRRALMCTGKAAIATPPDWRTNKEPYRAHWGISKLESGAKKLRLTSRRLQKATSVPPQPKPRRPRALSKRRRRRLLLWRSGDKRGHHPAAIVASRLAPELHRGT